MQILSKPSVLDQFRECDDLDYEAGGGLLERKCSVKGTIADDGLLKRHELTTKERSRLLFMNLNVLITRRPAVLFELMKRVLAAEYA
jgi:hypothetical protein